MAQYHHSKGIVLSALKYGESSRIVRVYTEEFGVLSFLVNSVGSKRGVVRSSMLLPLSLCWNWSIRTKGRENWTGSRRRRWTSPTRPFRTILCAMRLALFLSELFQKVLQTGEANAEKFDYVRSACLALDTIDPIPPAFHLAVWARLTTYLGFAPNLNASNGTNYFDLHNGNFVTEPPLLHAYLQPEASQNLRVALEWNFNGPLGISKQGRSDLMEGLSRYMNIHLDGFGTFKSLDVLKELFV